MKALSLRWKFALWAAALVGVSLLIFSAATLKNLYDEQIEAVDLELVADGKRFAELRPLSAGEEAAIDLAKFEPWLGYALFDEAGRLRSRSERLPEAMARLALSSPDIQTARDKKKTWRLGSFRSEGATFVVGYDLEEVHEIIHDLIVAYAFSLPVVVIIAAFGGFWVSRRALMPVHDLTLAAESVQAGSLDRRVPVPAANDEIQRLSVVFNAMLERLEKSFEQAQRFAADASHELRTPLTVIRGELEELIRADYDPRAHQLKLVSMQEEIDRLQRITENLLLLARLDARQTVLPSQTISLGSLVSDVMEDAELLAAAKGVSMEKGDFAEVDVAADPTHLWRALLNLFDNAVKFNFPDGRVTCRITVQDGNALCEVGNTGEGIPESLRGRLFQRFFRADASRGKISGHGLGLSLSREIVRAYGGELQLVDRGQPGWTHFVLSLPIAPSSPVSAVAGS